MSAATPNEMSANPATSDVSVLKSEEQTESKTAVTEVTAVSCDAPKQPKLLTFDQILAALDTQIKFEADSQRNEGWTRWTVWGALAALMWIATELWVQPDLNKMRMAEAAILIFVTWRFVAELFWILLPSSRLEIGPTRFKLAADTVHPLRPEVAVVILQYSAILFLLAWFKIPGQHFLWIYALVAVGGSLCMFISSRFIVGIPANLSPTVAINLFTYIQLLFLAAAGWQIAEVMRSEIQKFVVGEIRLALVLNAGAFLVSRLVLTTSSDQLLSKLTQSRQHIAFNRISLSDANKRTEALLTGITLSELLGPVIQAIQSESDRLESALVEAHTSLDQAQNRMTGVEPKPQEALRLMDQMGDPPRAISHQLKQVRKAWTRFAVQTFIFALYSAESKAEMKAIEDRVRADLAKVDEKWNSCLHRCRSLKADAGRCVMELTDDYLNQNKSGTAEGK